jgi:DNA invertase Pin-like site-specific DNA recombinase
MPNVTVIPAIAHTAAVRTGAFGAIKRRVAAYARVSTDSKEQLTSYEAQVDYYTRYITGHDGWEFVGIYTDEGISATSTKRRDGFNEMVRDALAGQIDLIVTKSVSRFARNTVDSLVTVRKLKEKGVEIYFEKESIYTLDSKGELLITIMSSLAQEESRSISENVTWGQRKRMADGKVSLPYKRFLGYDKGADKLPAINEGEAGTVRLIYRLFLEGGTPHSIATRLTAMGIPTPGGGARWHSGTVKSILTNEKYKGDARLQKSFTVDFLTKKIKANEGEVPQYYVEDSHPAIIESEVWDLVQQEMRRRKESPGRHSGAGPFSGRIVCGECDAFYGAKKWHSTDEYSRTVYQCNDKFKGEQRCATPHLYEDDIKRLFVSAVNKIITNKASVLADVEEAVRTLLGTAALDAEAAGLKDEMDVVGEMLKKCVEENARTAQDQDEYGRRYDALAERFNAAKTRLDEVESLLIERKGRASKIQAFLAELRCQDTIIVEFDVRLWHALVEKVTVFSKDDIRFTFKDGSVVSA